MQLHLSVGVSAGVPVVEVRGEVDPLAADDLYEFVVTVIRQRGARLGMDLAGVTFMDPAGVAAMRRARRYARARGGDLDIVAGPDGAAALSSPPPMASIG
ncbi:STAS domain-containing protein [Spongiactinospora sp. TRM90649]|uniref:STAS domain-containing protein n=1 Tax=Spongiactinospora sp. TRM90649 TaxID=3031114 RepID=UPI0023F9ECFE|nr:STAS domain-containing protein [Spongiactinospora sp. TRM90649]MDF5756290.1 STAS domain-containing protein [Spongiactinospora sp. TRM90649]